MDTLDLPKIAHPNFEYWLNGGDGLAIAVFKYGYYEDVPKEVLDAYNTIRNALGEVSGEIAQIRKWRGGVSLSPPLAKLRNPEITEETIQECTQVVRDTVSDCRVVDNWHNTANGVDGVSVRVKLNQA